MVNFEIILLDMSYFSPILHEWA